SSFDKYAEKGEPADAAATLALPAFPRESVITRRLAVWTVILGIDKINTITPVQNNGRRPAHCSKGPHSHGPK
ncbi:MAG: hypothetical protein VYA65_10660, partial [Pseudomonadota bacterium]|nr:hypothetical protein [Pseudomonadota bacterium]